MISNLIARAINYHPAIAEKHVVEDFRVGYTTRRKYIPTGTTYFISGGSNIKLLKYSTTISKWKVVDVPYNSEYLHGRMSMEDELYNFKNNFLP